MKTIRQAQRQAEVDSMRLVVVVRVFAAVVAIDEVDIVRSVSVREDSCRIAVKAVEELDRTTASRSVAFPDSVRRIEVY